MQEQEKSATTIRMDKECRDALEQFRREQKVIPTVPKAVEMILRDWLIGNSYLAVTEEEEEEDGDLEDVS